MSNPMPYGTFLEILRAKGLKVIEEYTGGRSPQYHNRDHKGPWGPVNGVMIHHTVTQGHDSTVSICRTGHSTLPGPLCHGVICKRGEIHIVGYGRANHAGLGDDDVLRAVVNETALPVDNEANTDGNRHFYGFECENLGDGNDPWPEAQLEAIELASAAICEYHGWSERSVIGHLEWQPGKVDPRGFSMDWMRDQIKEQLAGSGDEQEDDVPQYLSRTNGDGFTLDAGEWKTVWFDGPGGYEMGVATGKRAYHATAHVRLTGLPEGTTIQGRFYHQRPDGTRWTGPLVERIATNGVAFADFSNEGSVYPTEEIRFELIAFPSGEDAAAVTAVYVRGLCWE